MKTSRARPRPVGVDPTKGKQRHEGTHHIYRRGLSPADRIQQVRACAALLSSYLSLAALTAPSTFIVAAYFTRLSTSSTTPPPDPAGLLHFISSPVTVIVRGCVAPNQFGNVLCSIFNVKFLSATE